MSRLASRREILRLQIENALLKLGLLRLYLRIFFFETRYLVIVFRHFVFKLWSGF